MADSVQYLAAPEQTQKTPLDLNSAQSIVSHFRQVAYGQIEEAVTSLDRWILKGHRDEDAWNNSSVELTAAALAHLRYFVVKVNADNLMDGVISFTGALKKVLFELFEMLAFSWIQQNFGNFLRHSGVQVNLFKFKLKY